VVTADQFSGLLAIVVVTIAASAMLVRMGPWSKPAPDRAEETGSEVAEQAPTGDPAPSGDPAQDAREPA
jgi:hypothetical protein